MQSNLITLDDMKLLNRSFPKLGKLKTNIGIGCICFIGNYNNRIKKYSSINSFLEEQYKSTYLFIVVLTNRKMAPYLQLCLQSLHKSVY